VFPLQRTCHNRICCSVIDHQLWPICINITNHGSIYSTMNEPAVIRPTTAPQHSVLSNHGHAPNDWYLCVLFADSSEAATTAFAAASSTIKTGSSASPSTITASPFANTEL
jgi:hypothetical protein